MKILIDTNVLISAALYPDGICSKAYHKAVSEPFNAVISETNVDELHRIFNEKFPDKISALKSFLSLASSTLQTVPTPKQIQPGEITLRDNSDQPILRAAIAAGVDLILTGDKDFLESAQTKPRPVSPSEFIEKY